MSLVVFLDKVPMKKLFWGILMCLCIGILSCSKDDDIETGGIKSSEQLQDSILNEMESVLGKPTVIEVKTAGTLRLLMTPELKYGTTYLKIVGSINGTDIAILREMMQSKPSGGLLAALDLSECYIVRGGTSYLEENGMAFDTQDNIIGDRMFKDCDVLTYFIMPKYVRAIGSRAFEGCSYLSSLAIPGSLEIIGDSAFNGSGLTSLTIPHTVKTIGRSILMDCKQFQKLVANCDSIGCWFREEYGRSRFRHVPLKEVILGDSVRVIGGYAFYACEDLIKVSFSNALLSIGYQSFAGCVGLKSVSFPESLTTIGNLAFSYCTGLTTLSFSRNLKMIGQYAFEKCTGLTTLSFPEAPISIAECAFDGCTGLTNLSFPVGMTTICGFSDCTGLTTLYLSETLIAICGFDGCTSLTTLYLPKSLFICIPKLYRTDRIDVSGQPNLYRGLCVPKLYKFDNFGFTQ